MLTLTLSSYHCQLITANLSLPTYHCRLQLHSRSEKRRSIDYYGLIPNPGVINLQIKLSSSVPRADVAQNVQLSARGLFEKQIHQNNSPLWPGLIILSGVRHFLPDWYEVYRRFKTVLLRKVLLRKVLLPHLKMLILTSTIIIIGIAGKSS